jgi:hypothetical protein
VVWRATQTCSLERNFAVVLVDAISRVRISAISCCSVTAELRSEAVVFYRRPWHTDLELFAELGVGRQSRNDGLTLAIRHSGESIQLRKNLLPELQLLRRYKFALHVWSTCATTSCLQIGDRRSAAILRSLAKIFSAACWSSECQASRLPAVGPAATRRMQVSSTSAQRGS